MALQIVGPEKSNPHLLRQTDGERFFVLPEKRNSFDNLHSTLMNLLEKEKKLCVDGPAM
jgi:hypothetical protein